MTQEDSQNNELKENKHGTLTKEQAEKLVMKQPNTSGAERKLFGPENIKQLVSILTSPVVQEVDMYVLTGVMSIAELVQYTRSIPEYGLLENQVSDIARQVVEYMKRQTPNPILEAVKKLSKSPNDLLKLYNSIVNLSGTPDGLDIHGYVTYRNRLAKTFQNALSCYLFREIWLTLCSSPQLSSLKPQFHQAMSFINTAWERGRGISFPGRDFLKQLGDIEMIVRGKYKDSFEKFALKNYDKTQINEENNAKKFKEITDLSQFRRIFYFQRDVGSAQVDFIADAENTPIDMRNPAVCSVRINVNPESRLTEPKIVRVKGNIFSDDILPAGAVGFFINLANGELTFFPAKGISIAPYFDHDRYVYLKSMLYDMLLDYLRVKDVDIGDMFVRYEPEKQQLETHDLIDEAMPSESDAKTLNALEEEELLNGASDQHEELVQTESEAEEDKMEGERSVVDEVVVKNDVLEGVSVEAENDNRAQEWLDSIDFTQYYLNLSSRDVKAAVLRLFNHDLAKKGLKRLTDSEHGGRHDNFTSPRNNVSMPLPISHSSGVAWPILHNNLRLWGYTDFEFCVIGLGIKFKGKKWKLAKKRFLDDESDSEKVA